MPRSISCINWLDEGPLAPHGEAYKQYLIDRACAASTFGNCLGGVAHFVQWLDQRRIRVRHIDEAAVAEFLNEHLPRCGCAEPVQRDRRNCSAALGHLRESIWSPDQEPEPEPEDRTN